MENECFRNKYRIPSSRLQGWDYGQEADYFITICTRNRKEFFGTIIDGKMGLSFIGEMVLEEWQRTPQLRPDMNLTLHEFVIMPNHFHALIGIGENDHNREVMTGQDALPRVSTTKQSGIGCSRVQNRSCLYGQEIQA